jgi:preprotein translocase subunit SecG
MILTTFLYIIFVLSAIVLIVVVLLQEGRGGGFGQALGEAGQQTFGVGAKGINSFTGWTTAIFLSSAIALHILNRQSGAGSVLDTVPTGETVVPGDTGTGDSAPAGGAGDTTPVGGG